MGKLQEFLMSNQDDIQATAEVAVLRQEDTPEDHGNGSGPLQ